MKIWKYKRPCEQCGKNPKRDITNYSGNEPYDGNMHVVWSDSWNGRHRASLWDGESYKHKHDYFCSDKCAITYAEKVVSWQDR